MYLPDKYGLIRRAISKGSNFPEATTIEDANIETKRSGRGLLSPPTAPSKGCLSVRFQIPTCIIVCLWGYLMYLLPNAHSSKSWFCSYGWSLSFEKYIYKAPLEKPVCFKLACAFGENHLCSPIKPKTYNTSHLGSGRRTCKNVYNYSTVFGSGGSGEQQESRELTFCTF